MQSRWELRQKTCCAKNWIFWRLFLTNSLVDCRLQPKPKYWVVADLTRARATGLSCTTIHQGIKDLAELHDRKVLEKKKRIRAAPGGRKPFDEYDPTLRRDLELLVDPVTRGDPESPLRWTCKSTRQLAAALVEEGNVVGRQTVADLLAGLGHIA